MTGVVDIDRGGPGNRVDVREVLKQRLIGALILVALGIIFWPIIFVDQSDHRVSPTSIPPRPDVDTRPLAPPSAAELRGSPGRSEAAPAPAPTRTDAVIVASPGAVKGDAPVSSTAGDAADAAPVEPASAADSPAPAAGEGGVSVPRTRLQAPVSPELDADGVPVAWILQVATVSNGDKAESLRRQLLDIDEKAYVKRIRRGEKDLYRVYVGPKFERARLETLKPRIDSEFKVDSLVVRYLP